MCDNLSPKVFHAEGSKKKNPALLAVLALVCIAIAYAAYYMGMPPPARSKPVPPEAPKSSSVSEAKAPAAAPIVQAPKAAPVGENPNAPMSFRFNYLDKPDQWREWRRVSSTQWEETESSGAVTRFTVVGRIAEPDMIGTVVRRVSDLKMDVLIPDKQSTRRMHWRLAPDGKWVYMGQVSADATLPTAKDVEF